MRRLKKATGVVGREAKHLARTFGRTFLRVGGVCAALSWVSLVVGALNEPQSDLSVPVLVLVAFVYSLFVGAQAGLVIAFVRVVWLMVGAAIVLPLVVVPLALYLSFWAFSGVLLEDARELVGAMGSAADKHEWLVAAVGPAARVGPAILVIALPLLAADLVVILVQPAVLWTLIKLVLGVGVAFLVGAVPSALFSIVALVGVWVRRMKKRDEARHAQHPGASAP
jgi:hypothetical protein